jgi:hypothetical protein
MAVLGIVLAVLWLVPSCGSMSAGGESSGTGGSRQPRLHITAGDPVRVRGEGFRPGERVRLLVSPGAKTTSVRASGTGGFSVRLSLQPDRCTAVVVQAVGAAGSRAMVDVTTPDCTPID